MEQLIEEQSAALRERWAGSTANGDGTVTIGITEGTVPTPLANQPKLRIVTRRFPTTRLDAALQTVLSRLNPLLAPGIDPGTMSDWPFDGSVNLRENVVDVMVDTEHEAKRSLIETTLADELSTGTVRITYVDNGGTAELSCTSRSSCSRPFRGGTRVNSSTNRSCTLGFVMKQNGTGIRRQSTASHCADSPWSHTGIAIGPTNWTEDVGDHDFLVITQNNQSQPAPTNWVYLAANNSQAITLKLSDPTNGDNVQVCHEAMVSSEVCGLVTGTNTSFGGRSGFGKWGPDQFRMPW